MNIGRRLTIRLAILLLGGSAVAASPSHALTLEEALAALAANHPAIRTEEERVNAADQRLRGTNALFLPTVNLTSDYGYERIDSPTRRATRRVPAKELRESVTVNLTQNVFDGFRKNFDRRGAEEDLEAADDTRENIEQGTLFQGATAYIEVLRQSELIVLVRENEARIQRQFELESSRAAAGQGLAADVLLARQRLQQARERRVIFNGALQDALSRYRQLFGEMPDPVSMETPLAPIDLLPQSLDDALRVARRVHPLIAATNDQVDAARARQLSAQAQLFPRIDIVGRANFERDLNDTPGVRRDASVLLQATWDLFTGFSIQSNISAAAFDHAAILNNLQFVNLQVEEEVRFAWQGLQTSCERRFLLENALAIALEVLDLRRTLQAAGRETSLRVLDAETEVTDAQINLAAAVYDEMTSVYRMALAVGRHEVGTLQDAANFARTAEATQSMTDWCRQYANLDLSQDDPFFNQTATDGARADDPFAFRGDDLGGDAQENPFARPDTGASDADPFRGPAADEDDPFAFSIDDDDSPEPDAGQGLTPLFDDDTSVDDGDDPFASLLDEDEETGDNLLAEDDTATNDDLFADDQEISVTEDAPIARAPDRVLRGQEFTEFDLDDGISRGRDLAE